MITRIARHECRLLWRDHRFRWAAGLLVVLSVATAAVSIQSVDRRAAAIAAAQEEQRRQWLEKEVANPHVAAHAGTTVFRPLHPLTVFDSGVDDVVGQFVFLEAHRRSLFTQAAAGYSPAGPQFADLTVAFTVQVFVPLLVVILTFPAFVVEREEGTLRLLLSTGVRPTAVAIGKAVGLTAPIGMLAVPAMIVAIATLRTRDVTEVSRVALLIAAYASYLSTLVGLGLIVSARARSAQGALVTLLGLWLVMSFVVPRGAFAAAQHLYPVPTTEAFARALEEIDRAGNDGFMEQRGAIERRLLARYRVEKPVDLPVSTWGTTLYEREAETTARYNEEFARIYDTYDRQQRLIDLISIVTPPLALRTVSMALAGTDTAHYRHFADAAEAYRYALVQAMNTLAVESRLYNSSPTLADAPDQPVFPESEEAAYKQVGPFAYRAPDSRWALARVRVPAVSLLGWCVAVGGVLVGTARRVGRV